MKTKVAVLGAGASGMMAAAAAARAGAEVFLIEHSGRIGKKILSTGNGKCNFTNRDQRPDCYRSQDSGFPWQVVSRFGFQDTLCFFQGLGVVPREKNGYFYPAGGQASAMTELFALELERLGVQVQYGVQTRQITLRDGCFWLEGEAGDGRKTADGQSKPWSLRADRVILACGGMAAPATGSDGSGYALARQLGHRVTPVYPALVQLRCRESFYKELAGIRTEARVTLYIDGKEKARDQGELQLTAYGVSGIPVFQVSRYAAEALAERQKSEICLDLAPSMGRKALKKYFETFSPEQYAGLLNKKLLSVLRKRYGDSPQALAEGVKAFRTEITGTNPFENAQVTAGGVDVRQIDPETMMSRLVPGLYFAGEIVDVDGICGGYNLQWAWSSGYTAGSHAAGPAGTEGVPFSKDRAYVKIDKDGR